MHKNVTERVSPKNHEDMKFEFKYKMKKLITLKYFNSNSRSNKLKNTISK